MFCPNGCGRSYIGKNSKYNLNKHLKYTCGINPQFCCTFCGKHLRSKQSLQCHMSSVHKQIIL